MRRSRPICVRLDEDVRVALETESEARGISLATYLRQLVAEAARKAQRDAIRRQTETIDRYVAEKPAARAFYEAWGTPST